jgi:hypothetical protein
VIATCEIRSKESIALAVKPLETVHHLYIATLKKYLPEPEYNQYRSRYMECVRMLNGLERTLERQLDVNSRRWPSDSPASANPEP